MEQELGCATPLGTRRAEPNRIDRVPIKLIEHCIVASLADERQSTSQTHSMGATSEGVVSEAPSIVTAATECGGKSSSMWSDPSSYVQACRSGASREESRRSATWSDDRYGGLPHACHRPFAFAWSVSIRRTMTAPGDATPSSWMCTCSVTIGRVGNA